MKYLLIFINIQDTSTFYYIKTFFFSPNYIMVNRHHKSEDGMYHVKGKSFARLNGSRAEVMHETAYKTSGGLTKAHLKYNKHDHGMNEMTIIIKD